MEYNKLKLFKQRLARACGTYADVFSQLNTSCRVAGFIFFNVDIEYYDDPVGGESFYEARRLIAIPLSLGHCKCNCCIDMESEKIRNAFNDKLIELICSLGLTPPGLE